MAARQEGRQAGQREEPRGRPDGECGRQRRGQPERPAQNATGHQRLIAFVRVSARLEGSGEGQHQRPHQDGAGGATGGQAKQECHSDSAGAEISHPGGRLQELGHVRDHGQHDHCQHDHDPEAQAHLDPGDPVARDPGGPAQLVAGLPHGPLEGTCRDRSDALDDHVATGGGCGDPLRPGSRPTCFWTRTSQAPQVMPATATIVTRPGAGVWYALADQGRVAHQARGRRHGHETPPPGPHGHWMLGPGNTTLEGQYAQVRDAIKVPKGSSGWPSCRPSASTGSCASSPHGTRRRTARPRSPTSAGRPGSPWTAERAWPAAQLALTSGRRLS